MTSVMFLIGLIIGAVLGFGLGLVMLMPVLNQVSDLEDLLMRSRSDLEKMRGRFDLAMGEPSQTARFPHRL